jgi:hypothetical protein
MNWVNFQDWDIYVEYYNNIKTNLRVSGIG